MAVLLHKHEFKNIEVEFLKVSEKFDHQDFQILAVSASTGKTICVNYLCTKVLF